MTLKQAIDDYPTNVFGGITTPGKFEGEPNYVPFYWDLVMNGCEDANYVDEDGTLVSVFELDDDERKDFPRLKDARQIKLWEDDNGFVNHELTF